MIDDLDSDRAHMNMLQKRYFVTTHTDEHTVSAPLAPSTAWMQPVPATPKKRVVQYMCSMFSEKKSSKHVMSKR